MALMMPLQAYKFRVVPLGREDFADAFMANVVAAEIDLANKIFRVQVRQTCEMITLFAIENVINSRWIPELQLDTGTGFKKLIRFVHEPPLNETPRPAVKHSLRFDYSDSGVATHNIEWAFTVLKMEAMEAQQEAPPPAKPKGDMNLATMTPQEAMTKLESEKEA